MPGSGHPLDPAIRDQIARLYHECGGKKSEVARILGINRGTVAKYLIEMAEDDSDIEVARPDAPPASPGTTPDVVEMFRQLVESFSKGRSPDAGSPSPSPSPGWPSPTPTSPDLPGPRLADHPGLVHAPRPYERVLWLSDLHIPYHDQRAIDAALDFARDWKPDLTILGGDQFDCYSISRFDHDPERRETLQDEFDAAQPIWREIDALGSDVVFLYGNHEDRIHRLIHANPGLSRLRSLDLGRAAELPARWQVLPPQAHYRLGGLSFLHGDLKGGGGGKFAAHKLLSRLKTSCIAGHFHRQQSHAEPGYDMTVRSGFLSGHLCDVRKAADYIVCPDWTPGLISVDYDHGAGVFEVRQHVVVNGTFRHGGKTYGG